MNAKSTDVQPPTVTWAETLAVPGRHAAAVLPTEVRARSGIFWSDGSGVVAVPYLQRTYSYRRMGRWAKDALLAQAHIDVVPLADAYCELIVSVQAPAGWRRLVWRRERLTRAARALAREACDQMTREAERRGFATVLPSKQRQPAAARVRILRAG